MERKRVDIYNGPEYHAYLIEETFEDLKVPFLHLDFRQWTPSSFKKLLSMWKLFRETCDGTFYALSNEDDIDKWRKFVERLGFEYFRDIPCPDGKERPCYVSFSRDNNDG